MAKQLVFTSTPAGLRPGTRGFCTVAASKDMPPPLTSKLESLSGYTHVFDPSGPDSKRNPIIWSYLRFQAAGKSYRVLSRRSTAGADYTGRSNTIAHHLVLEPGENPTGAVTSIFQSLGMFVDAWGGAPKYLEDQPVNASTSPPTRCSEWEKAFGDPGYAGLLLRSCYQSPRQPAYIVYPEGVDALALMAQATSIAPEFMDGWALTFSTYFAGNTLDADCSVRFVMADTPAASEIPKSGNAIVIDPGRLPTCPEDEWVKAAREGSRAAVKPRQLNASAAPPLPPRSSPKRLPVTPKGRPQKPGVDIAGLYEVQDEHLPEEGGLPPSIPTFEIEPERKFNGLLIWGGAAAALLVVGIVLSVALIGAKGNKEDKQFADNTQEARPDGEGPEAELIGPSGIDPSNARNEGPSESGESTDQPTVPVKPGTNPQDGDEGDPDEVVGVTPTEKPKQDPPQQKVPDEAANPPVPPKPETEQPNPWQTQIVEILTLVLKSDEEHNAKGVDSNPIPLQWNQSHVISNVDAGTVTKTSLMSLGRVEGVRFIVIGEGLTQRHVFMKSDDEIAEVRIEFNQDSKEARLTLMQSESKIAAQALCGTAILLDLGGSKSLFYVDDAVVRPEELFSIQLPPESVEEVLLTTIDLPGGVVAESLVIDSGAFDTTGLKASIPVDGAEHLTMRSNLPEGNGSAKSQYSIYVSSVLGRIIGRYSDSMNEIEFKRKKKILLKQYSQVYRSFLDELVEINSRFEDHKDLEISKKEYGTAHKLMREKEQGIDTEMDKLFKTYRDKNWRGGEASFLDANLAKTTSGVESAIGRVGIEVESRMKQLDKEIENCSKILDGLDGEDGALTTLKQKINKETLTITLRNNLGVPVAESKLAIKYKDINELRKELSKE